MLCEPAYRISQQLKKTIAPLEETNILTIRDRGLPNPTQITQITQPNFVIINVHLMP